jgi:DDE superfamily endonuclease
VDFVSSFLPFVQPFESQMSPEIFSSWLTVLSGWILCRRHTVSGALTALGKYEKHFSAYHRLFATARWSIDEVGLALVGLIIRLGLAASGKITLVVDDTLCHKTGRKMFGVGMHYDAAATSRAMSNSHNSIKQKGHCWVVLGVAVQFPFRPGHVYCLPVLCRMFLNQKTAEQNKLAYQTKVELAVSMLQLICRRFEHQQFHLLSDSAYGGKNLLGKLPANCQYTCRWILNAALYTPLVKTNAKTKGRPRVHGDRLPDVMQMLKESKETLSLDVYGRHQRLRVASVIACFYATPWQKLRIVASAPVDEKGNVNLKLAAVFYSTDLNASIEQILKLYGWRWSIEVTFHDTKQQLGLSQPQAYTCQGACRAAPTLLLCYSVIVLWFANTGRKKYRPTCPAWYRTKNQPSFADMLATARQALLKQQLHGIFKIHPTTADQHNIAKTLLRLIKLAA